MCLVRGFDERNGKCKPTFCLVIMKNTGEMKVRGKCNPTFCLLSSFRLLSVSISQLNQSQLGIRILSILSPIFLFPFPFPFLFPSSNPLTKHSLKGSWLCQYFASLVGKSKGNINIPAQTCPCYYLKILGNSLLQ